VILYRSALITHISIVHACFEGGLIEIHINGRLYTLCVSDPGPYSLV
jgi:hypothetical protein